jgi:glutamate/aspartate transport system substrate-binding protein
MSTPNTLARIRQLGAIHVGFQRHTPPFSYAPGGPFEPVGYSVDLCRHVVRHLADALGSPPLRIVPVEVTSATRQGLLDEGRIDLECGSTTDTPARRERCAFSRPIFHTAHRVLLKEAPWPQGPVPAVTGIQGSTSQRAFEAWAGPQRRLRFVGSPDIGTAFARFRDDAAIDGLVADEVILASLVRQAGLAGTHLLPERLGGEPYAFMMRRGDTALHAAVDDALDGLLGSPAFESLYAAWFTRPLPHLGFDLAMPMSGTMRDLVRPIPA